MSIAVGIGYDSHAFVAERPLILGGIEIPFDRGLGGHSDGDAVCHAIADALLGAAGLQDIGHHFPPSDDRWKDADSLDLLARIVGFLEEEGAAVRNVDVTVVCEAPRLAPYREQMRETLSGTLRVPGPRVSVKGKSNEGMGWIGRGEGIAVLAVATVNRTASDRTGGARTG